MGSSFCFQATQKSRDELTLITNKPYKLTGPPHLFKPTPIVNILIFDEQIEKEESPLIEIIEQPNKTLSDQQFPYIAQISEEIDSSSQNLWVKKTYVIQTINVSNYKNDENNNKNNTSQQNNSLKELNKSIGKTKKQKEVSIFSHQQGSNTNVNSDKKYLQTKCQNRNK